MENNKNTHLSGLMQSTMEKVHEMVDTNTIVGQPITTPDGVTLIPVSKVSYGFASGGSDFNLKTKEGFGGGNGAGIKIDPIGFLVIKEGVVRMINVTPPASNTVDRLIDLVPQVMDRVDAFVEKQKKPTQK